MLTYADRGGGADLYYVLDQAFRHLCPQILAQLLCIGLAAARDKAPKAVYVALIRERL